MSWREVELEPAAYEREAFLFSEDGPTLEARWLAVEDFRRETEVLFPTGLLALLHPY